VRTTIRLDDGLLADARRLARDRGTTLTRIIEDSLRETLARRQSRRAASKVRLPTTGGRGVLPGVDLDDTASLLDLLESKR